MAKIIVRRGIEHVMKPIEIPKQIVDRFEAIKESNQELLGKNAQVGGVTFSSWVRDLCLSALDNLEGKNAG